MAYPVDLTTVSDGGPRSRGLGAAGIIPYIKQLLLLPHVIVIFFIAIAAYIGAWFGYWIVAFTGKMPAGLERLLVGLLRWQARTNMWFGSVVDEYPPFSMDAGGYDVDVVATTTPKRSRLLAVLGIVSIKFLLLLPHLFAIFFVAIVAFIGTWFGFWIILFTGKLPEGIGRRWTGLNRWTTRVGAWAFGVVDEYPPFSMS